MKLKQNILLVMLAAGMISSMTSCLKDLKTPSDASLGSPSVVEFQNISVPISYTSIYPQYSLGGLLFNPDTAGFNVSVNWAGAQYNAPQDITVTIALDTAALSAFNADQGTNYVLPPTDVFTFPTSLTIKKGTPQVIGRTVITEASDFDFSQSYALPLSITASTFGGISTNYGTAIYSFGGRNQYDGSYAMTGYVLRATDNVLSGNFSMTMALETVGANSVQFLSSVTGNLQPWANLSGVGVGTPMITINSDNTLTLSSSGGIYDAPGYPNRYDPATKTFYVSFTWGAGPTARLATDTLVYQGVR